MGVNMSNYVELPIDKICLDRSNPRIANFLDLYEESEINSDIMALLLSTTADACASLRESIKENGGIIHPIIVNKNSSGNYVVIEGNTRLQIYRDFVKARVPGNWEYIKAIVYDNLDSNEQHSIRLQAHLIGPREWDPYSKAKYLNYLANEEHMPMNVLIAYCGGNSKASEIRHMITAYQDMQEFYRPLCDDDSMFNIKKFHGFVELQNRNILENLILHGYDKKDFSQWMVDERFSKLEDVRRLPDILNSKKATEAFFKEDSKAAKKILAVEEISSDSLKNVPYDLLAKELIKRMDDFKQKEIDLLRYGVDYAAKLSVLRDVIESVQFIVDEVNR